MQAIPQELTDTIIENLSDDKNSLSQCATVCRSFRTIAQTHLFRTITLKDSYIPKVPLETPPFGHTRRLIVEGGKDEAEAGFARRLGIVVKAMNSLTALHLVKVAIDDVRQVFKILANLTHLVSLELLDVILPDKMPLLQEKTPLSSLRNLILRALDMEDWSEFAKWASAANLFPNIEKFAHNSILSDDRQDVVGLNVFLTFFGSNLTHVIMDDPYYWAEDSTVAMCEAVRALTNVENLVFNAFQSAMVDDVALSTPWPATAFIRFFESITSKKLRVLGLYILLERCDPLPLFEETFEDLCKTIPKMLMQPQFATLERFWVSFNDDMVRIGEAPEFDPKWTTELEAKGVKCEILPWNLLPVIPDDWNLESVTA